MPIYETTKADWKLFQALLPQWQERFMCRLCDEYAAILTSSKRGSNAFWEIEKRINTKHKLNLYKRDKIWYNGIG